MKNTQYIPTEYEECKTFVQWLRLNNIPHSHCANESQSGSQSAMIRGAKLKAIGQSRGVFDYDVYVPIKGVTGEVDCYELIKIEMKRVKGSSVSPEQKSWQQIYNKAGIMNKICKGAEEAIEFVKSFMNVV